MGRWTDKSIKAVKSLSLSVAGRLSFPVCLLAASLIFGISSPAYEQACNPALITTDSLLNTGTPNSTTYTAPGTNATTATIANGSNQLWVLVTDPYAITSGSGTIAMNYSGSGALTTTVSLSGLNSAGVNAYPFVQYGSTPYGNLAPSVNGQPPQFPAQLSSMCSLIGDISYSLTGTLGSGDIDVLYDLWLVPSNTFTGGQTGSLEVGVFPYFNFADGYAGTSVKTFTDTASLNGTSTSIAWQEYSTSPGGGANNSVFFYPPTSGDGSNFTSGEMRLDLLDFLNEASSTQGLNSSWWLPGIPLGTELGDNTSQSYTLTLTQFDIEQSLVSTPTPTPAPTPTPSPTPAPTPTAGPTQASDPTATPTPTPIGTTLTVANTSSAPSAGFNAVATLGPSACEAGQQILFFFQEDVVAATTDSSGVASALFFAPAAGGNYSIVATFAGSPGCSGTTGVGLLTDLGPTPTPGPLPTSTPTPVGPTVTPGPTPTPNPNPPTTVTVTDVTAQEGAVFLAAAGLRSASPSCVGGQSITFDLFVINVGTFQQVATTGSNGVASVTFGAPITPGIYTIQASFTGSTGCAPSVGTGTLTVPVPTPTTLTVANVSANAGASFVASATISPQSCALGQSLDFTFDGSSGSSVTNTNGQATLRFPVPSTAGFLPIQASFGGNPNCGPSTGTGVLTITGQTQTVTLDPPNLSFDIQALGSQSPDQEILLSNRQSVAMKVTAITISGGDATFTETDNCVGAIPAKGSCTINASFAPSASSSGKHTATLQVHDSLNSTSTGAAKYPQKVTLSGTGTPAASAGSTAISFGTQAVGTFSKPKAVTITNNLGVQLAFTNIATSGDFVVTGSRCSGEVARKSSCTVNVAFKPAATGLRKGTLTINDDASPLPVMVSLSGTGK